MPTPDDSSHSESTYIIDAENAAEMARLMHLDRLTTGGMGGLFPEQSDLSAIHDILDIACGPGGWVLDVARTYPGVQVVGIDISQLMIQFAHAQALTREVRNASFRAMDATKPLDFPDSSFDLVNARFLFGFMSPATWPKLLQECMRVLRPGGIMRLTDNEFSISNSLSSERLDGMFAQALKRAGQSFSPDGRHIGITPMLGRLLRDAGYQNIQKMAHAIDCSAGTEAHVRLYQNLLAAFKLGQPFLIKMGLTTQEEAEALYQRALMEMQSDDFCAIWFLLTVWGNKPK